MGRNEQRGALARRLVVLVGMGAAIALVVVLLTESAGVSAALPSTTTTTAGPVSTLPAQGVSPSNLILKRSSAAQDRELDLIKDLGGGHPMWVRIDWRPRSSRFAPVVRKARARGLIVIGLLTYSARERPSVSAFARQAGRLARRVEYVNLLNEPDQSGWTPRDAGRYTAAAYRAVKAANPNAAVIGPSLWKTPSQKPMDAVRYAQAMMDAGARWDEFDVHLYGDAVQLNRSWNLWAVLPNFRAALDVHGMASVPIISTEGGARTSVSYGTGPWGQLSGVEYQEKAVETGMDARSSLGVASYGLYSIMDDSPPGGFGVLDANGNRRPAFWAFEQRAR